MKGKLPPFEIGLIGCGFIFGEIYAPILHALRDRVRVVATCDVRAAAARSAADQFPGARVYTEASRLLEEEKLSAVMVLTTEVFNAPMAILALNAGVPVYLEKPPAVTVPEWHALIEAEASNQTPLFTAFNRRHTPLFRGWTPPQGVKRVRGVMMRLGRAMATFPYTGVHLFDSAQYFSGLLLAEASAVMEEGERGSQWKVEGRMENGAVCDWTLIPDTDVHTEYLVIETEDRKWTLHFPNVEGTSYPLGRLIGPAIGDGAAGGESREVISDPVEYMGYAPCFRDFLTHLELGDWFASPHGLSHCGGTIRLLESMRTQAVLRPSAVS